MSGFDLSGDVARIGHDAPLLQGPAARLPLAHDRSPLRSGGCGGSGSATIVAAGRLRWPFRRQCRFGVHSMSDQLSRPPAAPAADIRHRIAARAFDAIYRPRPPETTFKRGEKIELYNIIAGKIGTEPITYLEFGVHKGWSFRQIVSRFRNREARFFGFDSFEGLPEKWAENMDRGHFSTGGEPPGIADARVRFCKGWFQNTLPEFLAGHPVRGTVLVHFDADLYSSTLFLMTTLWHYVPEYYFIFDEFIPDEMTAMYDFARSYPVEYEFFACTLNEHQRPLQLLGRLRRVAYDPGQPSGPARLSSPESSAPAPAA